VASQEELRYMDLVSQRESKQLKRDVEGVDA
jgi:hypothetical protein